MSQVVGIVKISIDGELKRSKSGATLTMGGKKREPVTGHRVYGYTEEVVAAELEFTIAHMSDDDAVALGELVDQTVRFECDTGNVYTLKNATTMEPPKLTSGGDLSVKMMAEEVVAE